MSHSDAGPASAAGIAPDYDRFLDLFNRSEYWESHEALETLWRRTGSEFFHALILFASAFVHVQRGNRHGIAAQLGKALPLLESRRPHYLGLDVEAMLEHTAVCRHIVAENRDAPRDAWEVLIPQPRLVFDPARVRGDEPELAGGPQARPGGDPPAADPPDEDPSTADEPTPDTPHVADPADGTAPG